ncbi:MAG: hypothetical protein QME52_13810 [Bacteroidota bacterium]|nr:hypothetical protein [Bacteroidota bacterium]
MREKRYHIVISAIIFAVLMWISVNLSYEETIVKNIPIKIINLPEGKGLRYPLPTSLTIKFRGMGWQLAGLYFFKNLEYTIDLNLQTESQIITNRNLAEHLKLPPTIFPLDIKPETLFIGLDKFHEKQVSIIPNITIKCPDGYGTVGRWHIEPESVTVMGAVSLVQQINHWSTVYRKYDNQRIPLDVELHLEEPTNYGLKISRNKVRLTVDIQPFAERTISGIPLTALSVPSNRDVIFSPPKIDIIVRGGIDQLRNLDSSLFMITFDYQTLLQDSIGIITPVPTAPEGIKIIQRIPEQVHFIIRKRL